MTGQKSSRSRQSARLAAIYAAGGVVFTVFAWALSGLAWLLLWPAAALVYVSAAYAAIGPGAFGKRADGRIPLPVRLILAPYLTGAWLNSRLWTRKHPAPDLIGGQVWLGRFPSKRDLDQGRFAAMVDLSAELPGFAARVSWRAFPTLDLVTPTPEVLGAAAQAIENGRQTGQVLVVCALGYGRSAAAVATWLVASGSARDAGEAARTIHAARPHIVLNEAAQNAVNAAAGLLRASYAR